MKNFFEHLNEAKLRGNKGIPNNYLSSVDRRAASDIGRDNISPNQIMQKSMRAMEIMIGDVVDVHRYFQGRLSAQDNIRVRQRFSQLEELAELVIRNNYGSILDNVDLEIKLVNFGEVGTFMDANSSKEIKAKPELNKEDDRNLNKKADDLKQKEKSKNSDFQDSKVDMDEVKSGIDKQKIANSITQGEGKNTKNILHSEEVKEGLNRIFGQTKGREIFTLWDDIIKIANKLDWQISVEDKANMMERNPGGMAGACANEWPDKPEASEEDKEKLANSLENSEDPCEGNEESLSNLFSQGNPKIKAVGVDFPMLLHETVKGIYRMIAAVAIPDDAVTAGLIQMATTSFEDEAEDFKYGPYIAADLRDFVFRNTKSADYPNVREFVFGKLMEMDNDEFFDTIQKILQSKLDGTDEPSVRRKIDNIIDEIIDDIKKYELGEVIGHEDNNRPEEETAGGEDQNQESEIDKLISNQSKGSENREMSKSELQDAIDSALDDGDMETVKKLGDELNRRFPK